MTVKTKPSRFFYSILKLCYNRTSVVTPLIISKSPKDVKHYRLLITWTPDWTIQVPVLFNEFKGQVHWILLDSIRLCVSHSQKPLADWRAQSSEASATGGTNPHPTTQTRTSFISGSSFSVSSPQQAHFDLSLN